MTFDRLPRAVAGRAALALAVAAGLLAGCAAPPAPPPPAEPGRTLDASRAGLPYSSPECLAARLKPGDPFPASAIPPEALRAARSGWVAMRYDVIGGKAQNVTVVGSQPPGLYDAAALAHASRYRDPSGVTVRGCVMTVEINF